MIIDPESLKNYTIVTDAATMVNEYKADLVMKTAGLCADMGLKLYLPGDDFLGLSLLSKTTNPEFHSRVARALDKIRSLNEKHCLGLFPNAATLCQLIQSYESTDLLVISPAGWEGVEFQALPQNMLNQIRVLTGISGDQITVEPLSDLVDRYTKALASFKLQAGSKVIPVDSSGIYTDSKDNRISLHRRIGSGGEAAVFETDWSGILAKKFYESKNSLTKIRKISAICKSSINIPGLVLPVDLLLSNRKPCGYIMPQVENAENLFSYLRGTFEKRADLVTLAIRVVSLVIAAETAGLLIDDFGLKNILVNSDGHVFLIDMDSVQLGFFASEATDKAYWSSERVKLNKDRLISRPDTWFSLLVIIYQILHHGFHPMEAPSNYFPDDSRRIDYSQAVFRAAKGKHGGEFCNEEAAALWHNLPEYFQDLFLDAFHHGKIYSPGQLLKMLDAYREDLNNAKLSGEKMYSAEPWNTFDNLHVDDVAAFNFPEVPGAYPPAAAETPPEQSNKGAGWLKRVFCNA